MNIIDYKVRIVVEPVATPGQWHYHKIVQTDKKDENLVDPTYPTDPVRDFAEISNKFCVPTCTDDGLDITTNVGSAIVNDIYAVIADPDDKKYIKMSVLRDDISTDLEIHAFEKTTGEYGSTPAGKTLVGDLKEFSVVAAGIVLVEEEDYI